MKNLSIILTLLLCYSAPLFGAVVEHIGSYAGWDDVSWAPLSNLNDANDSLANGYHDFVGDSSDAGAYWADNGTYVFFRVRVAHAGAFSINDVKGSFLILLDVDDYAYPTSQGSNANGTQPDFSFSWDVNVGSALNPDRHGLEMSVLDFQSDIWSGIAMDDIDGNAGGKGVDDINGQISPRDGYRTDDGYLRTVDGVSTENFGDTAFIDIAVAWNYLETHTPLTSNQTWNVAIASIETGTDHNSISADVGGGASLTDQTTAGWAAVPEPSVMALLSISGLGLLIGRRLSWKTRSK